MASAELRTRIASSIVFGAVVLILTYWSVESFAALCLTGAIILFKEWRRLTKQRSPIFLPLGILYITAATASLIYLRAENLNILLAVLILVWTSDIAAYFVGKNFGKHKIAPSISPGKSWEGLGGAILACAILGAIIGNVAPIPHAILGAAFAIIGLGGDFFESALKRRAGVKDSGNLIPGHGGLFDRVDALLPCAIFAAVALYIRLHS